MSEAKQTPQERITAAIIKAIESGEGAPWDSRWDLGGTYRTANVRPRRANGQFYSGVNVLSLWAESMAQGFSSPFWFTYRQASEMCAQVRGGSKGAFVCYYGTSTDKRAKPKPQGEAQGEESKFRFLKGYTVFNAQQIDGLPAAFTAPEPNATPKARTWDDMAPIEAWTLQTGVRTFHAGVRAFYSPSNDSVTMPERERFTDSHAYYATLFHELTHATGASHRVGRQFGTRFGDSAYAVEELVAELGAAFLCATHGLSKEPRADHASYLASWLKVLKADSRAILTAASAAQKAHDWLVARVGADSFEKAA